MIEVAWHECEHWHVYPPDPEGFWEGAPGFWGPTCGGEFTCDECGELVGWCCGGSEAWEDPSKPDPGAICNECWAEHYDGEED